MMLDSWTSTAMGSSHSSTYRLIVRGVNKVFSLMGPKSSIQEKLMLTGEGFIPGDPKTAYNIKLLLQLLLKKHVLCNQSVSWVNDWPVHNVTGVNGGPRSAQREENKVGNDFYNRQLNSNNNMNFRLAKVTKGATFFPAV